MADTFVDAQTSEALTAQRDLRTEEMLVNMGPQHPSTHGVLRMVLRTDGEMILEATPHIGYLHRCAEKIGESLAPYQWIPYTDRMDYLSGMNNNQGYALAIEKLAGLEVPERAQYIRVIFAELNRIDYDGHFGYEACSPITIDHEPAGIEEVDRRTQLAVRYLKALIARA